MPKKIYTRVQLPADKPDRCWDCPLLGVIPRDERPAGSKLTHVCLGSRGALSGRGVKVRASEKDSHHPWRRPCDDKWAVWQTFPGRKLGIDTRWLARYREPFVQSLEMEINYNWKTER